MSKALHRLNGIGRDGVRAEKELARRLGATGTPASGAMAGAKGDMKLDDLLIESKSSTNDSMSVQLDWLAKISKEALAAGKLPALAINFTTGDGRPRRDGSWIALREIDLQQLLENQK